MQSAITFDAALDTVMALSPDEQDSLLDIVRLRRVEARRKDWADAAVEALAAYRRGELPALTAEETIVELRRGLGNV